MMKTVVGLYYDFKTAERVVRELTDAGIPRDDISLVAKDRQQTGDRDMASSAQETGGGMAAGAGTGAVLGGLAGLLVGIGALAIPGIGPIIAAGPLAATLAGAGVGAVAGGLVGALVDAGVPEQDANSYAKGIERGDTLVTVKTSDQVVQKVAGIMNRHDPINIRQPGWESTAFTGRGEHYYGETTSEGVAQRGKPEPGMRIDRSTVQAANYDTYAADFRTHYQTSYSLDGHGFAYYEPAYRYGYTLGDDESHRGRRWNDIEMEARRTWEREHVDSPWDDVKDAIRHGWEKVTGGR